MRANSNGDTEIVDLLLAEGSNKLLVDSLAKEYRTLVKVLLDFKTRALHEAVGKGDRDAVQRLLEDGPISEFDRGAALKAAAWNGHESIVELLSTCNTY